MANYLRNEKYTMNNMEIRLTPYFVEYWKCTLDGDEYLFIVCELYTGTVQSLLEGAKDFPLEKKHDLAKHVYASIYNIMKKLEELHLTYLDWFTIDNTGHNMRNFLYKYIDGIPHIVLTDLSSMCEYFDESSLPKINSLSENMLKVNEIINKTLELDKDWAKENNLKGGYFEKYTKYKHKYLKLLKSVVEHK